MNHISKKCRLIGIAASIAASMAVMGCNEDDSGLARRYRVTGKVTYKGEPVSKGTIAFEPTNPGGRVASGYIENGSYTLRTFTDGDGALPGDYKVSIASSDLDTSVVAKKTGGLLHQGDKEHQKALKEAKSPIPVKYAQAATSKLTAKVEASPITIDFPLDD
jgi:major membrane immunogen (membrane-anchored lipoprotein)